MAFQFSTEFLGVVLSAQVAFSKRSWPYMLDLALPWLMTQGQRSLTKLHALASSGRSLSGYYRFLSDGKFRLEMFWRSLFDLIVSVFRLKSLLIVADDTLCPKWGHRIFGTASFFDHVSRPRPGFIWGHNWVVLSLIVQWRSTPIALPFWVQLYRPEKSCAPGEFRTRLQIVAEALKAVRRRTFLPIQFVADGAYNNKSLIQPLSELGIPLISRLRADAVLRRPLPLVVRPGPGRRAVYGPALPPLAVLSRRGSGWKRIVVHIYRTDVTLWVKVIDALWPACQEKLRVVIVRDPKGRRRTCYLSSTDLSMPAEQIIETFAKRWSIEQLFSDVKKHLGLDSAELRCERSVIRHATLTFAFATWVHVWHHITHSKRSTTQSSKLHQMPCSFRCKLQNLRKDVIKRTIFPSRVRDTRLPRNSNLIADLFVRTMDSTG